jgi:acetolactate synthase-1/2/3 large subunit
MPAIIATLQRLLPQDTAITNGAGNFASWVHRYFRFHGWSKGHKTQLAPTSGAMGYGVPAGIAANLITGRTAFTIAGDGDFLMNGQELATALQHGGKSIIVLLNNGIYGTIRMHQEREYPAMSAAPRWAIRTSVRWPRPTAMRPSGWNVRPTSKPHCNARWRHPRAR